MNGSIHVNKVQGCVVACLWYLGIRNQSGHTNAQSLHSVLGIDTHNDAVNIHPLKFCQTGYGSKHSSTMSTFSLHSKYNSL